MKENAYGPLCCIFNDSRSDGEVPFFLKMETVKNAQRIHRAYKNYAETPLVDLAGLARRLGVKAVFVKDESKRFGLNAFKGLGGMYALFCLVCRELGLNAQSAVFEDLQKPEYRQKIQSLDVITTTDGNHGRGLAWAALQLGCRAHVYMPAGSSPARAQAIRSYGAECCIMKTGYDDTVRMTAKMARERGWHLVQDTSWGGYEEIPSWIIQGYTTIGAEAAQQLEKNGFQAPTHVFLQAGVGAMAGGLTGYLADRYSECRPEFCIVEPENMACIYRSAQVNDGKPHAAVDTGTTIMAGLNCGEPCTVTWPVLRDFADWYIKCPDYIAAYGMRLLGAPTDGDPQVISGESGAVTAGALAFLSLEPECRKLKEQMKLDENSVILLISTEGDTDPGNYDRIVHKGAFPVPEQEK
ncbi:MAG: diaminopropionate ammonia-lyase [Pyramidobacter sp.]